MSLLTSPNTTKDQLKFLNKMERHYHRRGASQYLPKQRKQSHSFSTRINSDVVLDVKAVMEEFMVKIRGVIGKFDAVDHYRVLDLLRKHQFFSDVATFISNDLYTKIQNLEREVTEKELKIETIRKSSQTLENLNPKPVTKVVEPSIKYNPAKSVGVNLYYHAKVLSEQDFVDFYNKVSLTNNLTLKKVQNISKIKDQHSLAQRLNELMQYGKNHNNERQIIELTQSVNQLIHKKQCRKPCCQDKSEDSEMRLSKAKTLMTATMSKANRNVYKNDKSEEYFSRYYRGPSFKVNNITSVERTKLEEMEKIQIQYKRNVKLRSKKNQEPLRYASSSFKEI